jgi:hypothetical protein
MAKAPYSISGCQGWMLWLGWNLEVMELVEI